MGLILRFLVVLFFGIVQSAAGAGEIGIIHYADLPPEARQTLRLIDNGGPYPYKRDGITFGNYEGKLPQRPRGFYREFTVPTPTLRSRGARRIITGRSNHIDGRQTERYYTEDHYRTFLRIEP